MTSLLGRTVRSLSGLVERRLLAPSQGAASLAILRIVYSAVLLYDIGLSYAHRQLLFDAVPFLEPSRFPIGPALLVWMISALLLLVGYQTRVAALLNYLFSVFFIGFAAFRNGFEGHWDVLMLHAGWIFLLLPVGRAISVDAYLAEVRRGEATRADVRVGNIGEVVIIALIASMYLDSCAYKLCSPMYLNGLGLWAPASLPYALHDSHVGLLDSRPLITVMGYFALLFELAFVVLACFRRLRSALVIAGLCFHLTILAFFPIWSFSIMMSALYLALLPSQSYERPLRRWLPRTARWLGLPEAGLESPAHDGDALPRQIRPMALAIAAGFAFWLASCLIILLASPFPATYLFIPKPLANRLSATAKAYKSIVYPWTGFSTHAVFVDSHFRSYRSQVRLVYRGPNQELQLPIVDRDGTCIGYNTGRVWALWAFRTVAPELPLPRAEANLRRFIQYWAIEERKDISAGSVEIQARPVDVSLTRWQPHLLDQNLKHAWRRIGVAQERAGELQIAWDPANARRKLLSDLEVAGSLN